MVASDRVCHTQYESLPRYTPWTAEPLWLETKSPHKLRQPKAFEPLLPRSGGTLFFIEVQFPMGENRQGSSCVRFGVFELDLRAGELRKQGLKVRLQQQPFQVLSTLIEHHGEVVSREELQKKLWPADTFVDFDHGLNKAVNKVREALGDSAESPRFVETVGRRGYRFVGDGAGGGSG